MNTLSRYLKSALVGLVALMLGMPAINAQEEEEKIIDSEGIQNIVSEAQRMAQEWAARIREWKEPGEKRTTYMGIVIESVPDVLRDYIDLPKGVGLLLSRIAKDGPAEEAGLKDNDIIVSFGGQLVINFNQLSTLIDLQGPGAEVPVKILRKGKEMEFTVTLVERLRRNGQFIAPDAPDAPEPPELPELPDAEELGAFMERIEEWIPGSVSIFVDQDEQVHVDLQDLKENLQDLRVKLERLRSGPVKGEAQITREFGDFGARTSIVHVGDRDVNYTSKSGKLVLNSSDEGLQAFVWDTDGEMIYQGALPEDFEKTLPPKAVEIIKAYNASRENLQLDTNGNAIEIHLKEEAIEPLTHLSR